MTDDMNQTLDYEWINFVDNKESILSLYTSPPALDIVLVKTIDITNSQNIRIVFSIKQLPDIVPRHGLWHKQPYADEVRMVFVFTCVSDIQINHFTLSENYRLTVCGNPEYVRRIILVDNVQVLERTERLLVKLSNNMATLSFNSYSIIVRSIRPLCLSDHNLSDPSDILTDFVSKF
jgi:hypothetical protein